MNRKIKVGDLVLLKLRSGGEIYGEVTDLPSECITITHQVGTHSTRQTYHQSDIEMIFIQAFP